MSDIVSAIWVRFAKTGNPNGPALPELPGYGVEDDVLLDFGPEQIAPVRDHEKARMEFFEARFDKGEM